MTAQIKNCNAVKKFLMLAMAFLLLAALMPVQVYANSAEPPSMVIWSVNAPSDTQLVFNYGDGSDRTVEKSLRLWEKVWFLYGSEGVPQRLTVQSSKKALNLTCPTLPAAASAVSGRFYGHLPQTI